MTRPSSPPPATELRSWNRVDCATRQPPLTSPMTRSTGTLASVRNTSQKLDAPFICLSGRASIPGCFMSMAKYVMPACLGTSTSVRASSMPKSAESAEEFQTF